ncbi:hypothetical protein NY607_23745 [Lysinibacillus sp. A4]|uniref:hypothetical protein n=1 Tax=unclassified Lysinibacillus TaxID=2636778 RepID=UPI002175951E|nr:MULTISPECIES: hypothetical protein [unclassified Lysinibacillus]MCS5504098.1 hypothetical protein [Lysinibacillus sp. A4]WGT37905.1 hypothetical protein QH639_19055 [Lysinibacillus sp. 1 U-2021]
MTFYMAMVVRVGNNKKQMILPMLVAINNKKYNKVLLLYANHVEGTGFEQKVVHNFINNDDKKSRFF